MYSKNVKVTVDRVAGVIKSIGSLTGQRVLVGVPAQTTGREDETTNATLAYIHDNGSPANNIPARPFMRPGIAAAKKDIEARLKVAANAALNESVSSVDNALGSAGQVASDRIRMAITNGNFAPLSPETIRGRARSRGTKSRREDEKLYLSEYKRLRRSGMDSEAAALSAQSLSGIKPLINTSEMLKSITYVIRKIK